MTRKKDHHLELLKTWLANYREVNEQFDKFSQLTGSTPDSPLQNQVWLMFQSYTDTVADLMGDHGDWLTWFIYDNQQGKRGFEVDCNGKKIKVRTLRDLLQVIRMDK